MSEMIAYTVNDDGTPIQKTTRERPEPGKGEVLVKLTATSLNFHDYINILGMIPGLPTPRVPFSDGVGEIIALGEGVTNFQVGDRVCPNFFPKWQGGKVSLERMNVVYGDQIDGCLRQYGAFNASALVKAPSHMSDAEAATLGCAGLTAWRALCVEAQLEAGETVVVQGTGGVSIFALQIAKMKGAKVIATSSSDEKLERAKALGADHLINYKETPDWAGKVREFTGGMGADVVVEIGGQETFEQAINATTIGGHVSVIGVRSGFQGPAFPIVQVMQGNIAVKGITVGSVSDFEAMNKAMELAQLKPVIGAEFDADNAMDAVKMMEAQTHFGKIAINISH